MGDWGVVKKYSPPQNTAPPKQGFLGGGNLVCFNQRGIKIKCGLGRPELSGVEGGGRSRGWGVLFGNWGEGTALPLLGSPQPLRSGRKGAACNPRGQVWGCQMLQAGGWRGLTKACPPER